jgi:hypothetical protein
LEHEVRATATNVLLLLIIMRCSYLYPYVYGKTVQESIWYASSPNVRYMIDHPEARERLDADGPLRDPASLEQPPGQ